MKLAATVIAYKADINDLFSNINRFLPFVDVLIIWDNSPGENIWDERFQSPNIVIMSDGKNVGISKALNTVFNWAIKNGFEYILTMDQDSIWPDFYSFKEQVDKEALKKDNVCIWAPLIKCGETILRCNRPEFVITSGSIYNLNVFQKVGQFREEYFIDEVDNEYCIRSRINGFNIKLIKHNYLVQQFGETTHRNVLDKYTSNYSPIRTYYQIRNRTWVWREYHKVLNWRYFMRTLLIQTLRRSLIILLNEDNKSAKLTAIIRGWYHGIFKKYGSIDYIEK